ncbi:MAG: hypothetical protein WC444_07090 [Candidatus Paceibacterota bacterium]
MKVRFEIYSSILKEVKELSDGISKNMQSLGQDNFNIKMGWKIGEVTVTLPKGKSVDEIKKLLQEKMQSTVPEQNIWLKEVAYEKK